MNQHLYSDLSSRPVAYSDSLPFQVNWIKLVFSNWWNRHHLGGSVKLKEACSRFDQLQNRNRSALSQSRSMELPIHHGQRSAAHGWLYKKKDGGNAHAGRSVVDKDCHTKDTILYKMHCRYGSQCNTSHIVNL